MKYIFKAFLSTLFLLVLLSLLPQTSYADTPWLSVNGNKIVDPLGNEVILRGVNMENREWSWRFSHSISYEQKAIPVATAKPPNGWGANVILIAVGSGPINRNEADYLDAIDKIVQLAKSNNAYTMVVYRYDEPDAEQPEMPDQAAQDALATLAIRYKDESSVIYGLQVEPHNKSWAELKPRFISMIDAIRANNPKSLIAVPGTNWSRYIYGAIDDPINRTNLIYKTHPYDTWQTIKNSYRLDEVTAKIPVFLGEFGAGSMMTLSDVKSLLDYADQKKLSWTAWMFNDKGCPCMLSNAKTFATTDYGNEIKTRLQKFSSENKAPTSPSPTTINEPSQTSSQPSIIDFSISLPGVGNNPSIGQNASPLKGPTTELYVYDSQDKLITQAQSGSSVYDPQNQIFKGSFNLDIPTGQYNLKIRSSNSLFKNVPQIIYIEPGKTVSLPTIKLNPGDTNQDNMLDLVDYNIIISCYGGTSCSQKDSTDLNLDGKFDEQDLNIFYAELAKRLGD